VTRVSQGNESTSSDTRQEGSCTPADQSRHSWPVPGLPRRQQVLLCNCRRFIWLRQTNNQQNQGRCCANHCPQAARPAACDENTRRQDSNGWSGATVQRSRQTMGRSTRHYIHNDNPKSLFRKWSGGTNGPLAAVNCDNSSRPRRNVGHVLGLRSRGRCIKAQRIADGKECSLSYTSRNCFWKTSARVTFPRLRPVQLYDKHVKRQEPAPSPSDFMPILAGSQRTQVQSGSSTHKPSRNLSPRRILTSAPSSTGAFRTPAI
jgi:hypothetical protein